MPSQAIDRHWKLRCVFFLSSPLACHHDSAFFWSLDRLEGQLTLTMNYDADHPDIALLRLKNYTMLRKLADDEVLGETGFRRIAQLMETLAPWITYCNSVVMPDEASEEDDDHEAEHEGEDEDEELQDSDE
ncbi:hypothetical protein AC579_9414 [Pseudocercospora musae]|uniref:Uncharacterized protein n=1 Tax=Pseudocercospora musae TaxID=113226 RepID=A0A139I1R8_9PEZI|nr:hypothetical protein AC579_9414 [Pseudocercospora musae]KXT08655.1 hypothetical protein AC579_9414 [Pseudocercospora musae]KXT08656.1 hypothetical protein AC579_9414 [Pseudocercospora musae]KXT08659.1 hypothetical protein AC579_9414 [Pseudocercospora musae]